MSNSSNISISRLAVAGLGLRPLDAIMALLNAMIVSFLRKCIVQRFLTLSLVERPYDPRPYDSRYSRDFDDRRGGRDRRDDYRGGGGRDYDRYRDYDRERERGDRGDRGYGRDRYDDRRH